MRFKFFKKWLYIFFLTKRWKLVFCILRREISPLRVSKKYLRWCRRSRRIEWYLSWPPLFWLDNIFKHLQIWALAGRNDNRIWRTGPPGYKADRIDSWAPETFKYSDLCFVDYSLDYVFKEKYRVCDSMPDLTITWSFLTRVLWATLCQSQLYPPVRDYEFGLIDIKLTDLKLI